MDEDKGQPDLEARFKALEEQIAAKDTELDALRRDQLMMIRGGGQAQAPQAPQQPQLSYEGLPDPEDDRAGYERELGKRTQQYVAQYAAWERQQEQAQYAAAGAERSRSQSIVDMFHEKYPGYSEAGAKAVAAQLLAQAEARGWDTEKYVYGNPEMFVADVAKAYEAEFGKPAPKGPEPAPETGRSPEEEWHRTGGIPGGRESGGAPSGGGKPEPEDNESFRDLYAEGQRKTGLF